MRKEKNSGIDRNETDSLVDSIMQRPKQLSKALLLEKAEHEEKFISIGVGKTIPKIELVASRQQRPTK